MSQHLHVQPVESDVEQIQEEVKEFKDEPLHDQTVVVARLSSVVLLISCEFCHLFE